MYNEAFFDQGVNRIGTDCEKWDGMRERTGDPEMLPMWVADMDFATADEICEAVNRVAKRRTWGYTMVGEADSQAVCSFWKRRHEVCITPEDVLMAPCVVTSMRVAIQSLTPENSGVLITPPVYGPFFRSVLQSERKIVESPLKQNAEGRWMLNFEEIEQKMASSETAAFLFCSPHNPCGRLWEPEEIERLAEICMRYNKPMICDEIHADFTYDGKKHYSLMRVEAAKDIAVMLCAASKTFNLAGLQQCSIICRNEDMRRKMADTIQNSGIISGNAFALAATRAAYQEGDAWLDALISYLTNNRNIVMTHAGEKWPNVRITPLEATYLMWLDIRALGLDQEEALKKIEENHVMVNDGLFFGELGRGFIRLNIACPRKQLQEALTRLDAVLA